MNYAYVIPENQGYPDLNNQSTPTSFQISMITSVYQRYTHKYCDFLLPNSIIISTAQPLYQFLVISFYQHQDAVIDKYLIASLILPILTLPIYLEGAYCLYSCNDKLQQHYVHVLRVHVSLSLVGEIYGFFFMRPVVFLPVVGLYSTGLFGYLQFPTFLQIIILFFLYQINACTMIHLLILRLKSILPLTFRFYRESIKLGTLFVHGTYITSVISLSNFALLLENQDIAKHQWSTWLNGNVPNKFWTDNYIVTSGSNLRFSLFLKLCGISLVTYIAACIAIPTAAFQILNRMNERLSTHVVNAQKQYIKGLVCQIFIIVIFLLLPFTTFIVGLEMRIHYPETFMKNFNLVLVTISITLAMIHGAAATFAMILANKPHRVIFFYHLNYFYTNVMKFIPIVTIPIYLEAIYCIIKRSPSFQKHYTVILTAHILGCLYEEFYGFQLFRPMVFVPIVGIYADGILSMLGVHPFIQLYGMFMSIQINSAILTHITFYRMKIIIPMSFRYYTRVIQFGIFSTVFMYVGAILSVNSILLTIEDQMTAKNLIYMMNIRPIPTVFWSEKYMVSSPKNPNTPAFLVCGTICIGFYILLCITLPSICFIILHRTRHSLSDKVIKAQRAYLRTILLQVLIVVVCIIMPFSVFFAGMANMITNPVIIPASLIFALCHGSASTLIHLLSNKPFRDTMKTQLSWVKCLLTCSSLDRSSKVHTMSSIVG
ncbi:Protein CBR-SRH-30 [Caenorhabditis briggsae]|uniref:Protein CBR-SRH-30 n=1 Tax=Caenorhabditis briggsae TaxID=6238 RepID=A8XUK6_CAEBR|nr:Protein CBR-SRH-30 [Caenorhabditis briggsae]CAP36331.2 Protein CBR-SRH-30 [Caenorhabditis briggsae]